MTTGKHAFCLSSLTSSLPVVQFTLLPRCLVSRGSCLLSLGRVQAAPAAVCTEGLSNGLWVREMMARTVLLSRWSQRVTGLSSGSLCLWWVSSKSPNNMNSVKCAGIILYFCASHVCVIDVDFCDIRNSKSHQMHSLFFIFIKHNDLHKCSYNQNKQAIHVTRTYDYDPVIWVIKVFILLQASAEKKPVGSTSGMQTSVQTSCLLKVTPPTLPSAEKNCQYWIECAFEIHSTYCWLCCVCVCSIGLSPSSPIGWQRWLKQCRKRISLRLPK